MLGDPNSFRRTEPAVQLFITLTHYVCRRGSRINTERFLTSRKVWGHTPSGIVFLDFNSPKVPFPGFLSHSDSIFTDCPNHFPDFNLESLKFSFSIPKKKKWKIWQIFIKRWKPVWIRAWFGWSHEKYDVRPRPNIHNNYHLRTSDWWEKKKRKGNVVIARRKAEKSRELLLEDSWLLHDREFSSNMIFYDKMATVVLFWNINMAAVTSCANARWIYPLLPCKSYSYIT